MQKTLRLADSDAERAKLVAIARNNRRLAKSYVEWAANVRKLSPLTTYQYADKLESFLAFAGSRPFGELTLDELETWIDRPRKKRGNAKGAASTLAWDVGVLRNFYRYLMAHGHVKANPCELLVAPKVRNLNPRAIEDATWIRLWNDKRLREDERIALGLGYFCGLRRAEIAALRVDQVNLERRQLVGFIRKGGGDAVFPYGSAVQLFCERLPHLGAERFLTAFENHVSNVQTSYVLLWATDRKRTTPEGMTNPDQINKRLMRLLQRLGIKEPFTPHALRHSFVTKLLEAGIPLHVVSRLANHSDVATTMRYVKTALDPLAEYLSEEGRLVPSRWADT